MNLLLSYTTLGAGCGIAAILVSLAIKLVRADKLESKKSAARVPSLTDALLGRARTREDWMPDARVKGGIVFNKRRRRIEISGRLSEDSFDRVFH